MKMIKTVLAFVCISALTLTSCSNDDDNFISTDGDISGKWNYNRTITILNGQESSDTHVHEPGCEKDYQEFAENDVFRDVVLFRNASNACTEDSETGTWSKSGNTLMITGNRAGTYTITRLDGSELHYQITTNTSGVPLTVKRIFTRN